MTLDEAIDVFVGAAARMRSQTFPCIGERIGPIWRFRDAERRKGDYRNEEYVTYGIEPAEVAAFATAETRGKYAICYILRPGDDGNEIRANFKGLQYRLCTTEPFFIHHLTSVDQTACSFSVRRVTTVEEADRLTAATRKRQIRPAELEEDPPIIRQYWALDGERPIGWVRSVRVGPANWCSNLWVNPAFRRQGVGRTLMSTMLVGDREAGSTGNVLLASHTGAMLYPTLGYERIGELLVYTPTKAKRLGG